jgi:ABC-2 type transport system permease protein
MRWYAIFIKGLKEQVREYWILILTIAMAPIFIAVYYLMAETEDPVYEVALVNLDQGADHGNGPVNLGDSIVSYSTLVSRMEGLDLLKFSSPGNREQALQWLRTRKADVAIVLPENLSLAVSGNQDVPGRTARIELIGDVTRMEYVVGAVWSEELIGRFLLNQAGIRMPFVWQETTLGFSGARTSFELYMPGLLILSIIMIIFSASAALVREPEARTLERLRISRLTTLEFLSGLSLVQILVAIASVVLALFTAIGLGYTLIPGTLGFILLVSMLTALSMISFSLLVAAMCRSVKEVAIIGTFPLFLLMFFTGAAFPVQGGGLFYIGGHHVMLNEILSPTFAVNALNKVLVRGLDVRDTLPDMLALVILTVFYFITGAWAFRQRHMKAR